MGLFNFLKKDPAQIQTKTAPVGPYSESATNVIYNLLFCDSLDLYKEKTTVPYIFPFDILFSESSSQSDLQKIIDAKDSDPRIKVLAYNKLTASGQKPLKKEILAVIVEVGLDGGLDVLASFNDGTARYINKTGKILIWETREDQNANNITTQLFKHSKSIVNAIGVWDKPRLTAPVPGNVRISFLVSDGLYFGEGPTNDLFNDPMAGPALRKATELLQYITEKSMESKSPGGQ